MSVDCGVQIFTVNRAPSCAFWVVFQPLCQVVKQVVRVETFWPLVVGFDSAIYGMTVIVGQRHVFYVDCATVSYIDHSFVQQLRDSRGTVECILVMAWLGSNVGGGRRRRGFTGISIQTTRINDCILFLISMRRVYITKKKPITKNPRITLLGVRQPRWRLFVCSNTRSCEYKSLIFQV